MVAVAVIAFFNSGKYEYMATHFGDNTYINGADCSGLTAEEAKAKLTDKWDSRVFKVVENGKTIGKLKCRDCTYDIDSQLNELLSSNLFRPLANHTGSKDKNFKVSMKIVTSKKFQKQIDAMHFLDRKYKVKTKNAYVDMNNKQFKIVKEVQGDNIDESIFVAAVKKDIARGDFKLAYTESDYYDKPEVKAGDQKLKDEQSFDKKNYSQVITYKTYDGDYTVKPKYLAKMMPADGSGGTEINEKAVRRFVNKKLAWDINTAYAPRKFKTAGGDTITVEGGNYGYIINKKKEYNKLLEELKSGKDVTRSPIYSQTPYYKGGGMNDIGSSYIEVDISAQELWLYKKGKRKLETSVVTGNAGNHDTPTGVYEIAYKQRNTTLKGENDDGSDYNSKVSYWMPFNGGIGCHDADWRGSFGGSIYQGNGSHGCVNMPPGDAASLYYSIEKGFPVVVHE